MAIIYIDKCQYEIQEQKKFRYSMPVYTGQFSLGRSDIVFEEWNPARVMGECPHFPALCCPV
jgi:hypothetical protein